MKKLKLFFNLKRNQKLDGLKKTNLILSGLYLAQLILLIIFAKSAWVSITTNYLAYDSLLSSGEKIIHSAGTSRLFDINIAWLLFFILGVSCFLHLILATKLKNKFELSLKSGSSSSIYNWVIYGMFSSLIILVLSLLSGVFDISSLVLILSVSIFASISSALYCLRLNKDKHLAKPSLIISITATLLPWLIVLIYIIGTIIFGGNSISAWVYLVYLTVMLTQVTLAYVFTQMSRKIGKWRDLLYSVKIFFGIIFISQTLVIWQIFLSSLK